LGKGSIFSGRRGLGPIDGIQARGARFRTIGIAAIGRTVGLDRVSTADLLAELGGTERRPAISPAELEAMKGEHVGRGQQGDVWRVVGRDDLVVKEFNQMSGATPETQVRQLYDMHAVLRAAKPGSELANGRVTRIESIGRTTNGRGFLVAEFARGVEVPEAWLLGPVAAEFLAALRRWNPTRWGIVNFYRNILITDDGHFTVVDPG
jgi:hypothetical protein